MRIPEYIGFIDDGSLKPGTPIEVKQTGPTTAEVDCGYGFGAVGGAEAIRTAVETARQQRTACVITRRCNHVGRLGAYVQMAADAGMIALATCNSPIDGHFVLPFGGREGRLATNLKSSPPVPGVDEVLVPGELEFRTMRQRATEGIPVDEPTWESIRQHADRLSVPI